MFCFYIYYIKKERTYINYVCGKIRKFIYYGNYSSYNMESTTIQISRETKSAISTFGTKEDTYDDIIKRMYDLAVKEQLREFLFSKKAIPIDEAIRRAKERWQQ